MRRITHTSDYVLGHSKREIQRFSRNVIIAALTVDRAEVAKLISVARAVLADVVRAIGPAPRAGRPRLVSAFQVARCARQPKRLHSILASESWQSMTGDRRFEHLFAAFSQAPSNDVSREHWDDPAGWRLVTIEKNQKRTTSIFNVQLEPNFAEHVAKNLGDLYTQFKSRGGE